MEHGARAVTEDRHNRLGFVLRSVPGLGTPRPSFKDMGKAVAVRGNRKARSVKGPTMRSYLPMRLPPRHIHRPAAFPTPEPR